MSHINSVHIADYQCSANSHAFYWLHLLCLNIFGIVECDTYLRYSIENKKPSKCYAYKLHFNCSSL
jgi:hypothetical protein